LNIELASRQAQQMANAVRPPADFMIRRISTNALQDAGHPGERRTGAMPKLTMWQANQLFTNSLLVPVARATNPSKESKPMAKPMAFAQCQIESSPFRVDMTA